jgi:NAD(P)H-dependent FMN reductase
MPQLLIIAHAPSANTRALAEAVFAGATSVEAVTTRLLSPFETQPRDILEADGLILGTTENLGYMAGATKDMFDRCYYAVIEHKQGLPMAVYIRAGHDGTGTRRAIDSITTGLRWRAVQEPQVLRGAWQEAWPHALEELGQAMAYGLEAGIF